MLSPTLGRWANRIGVALLVAALGIAIFGGPKASEEKAYPNYSAHVQPLEEHIDKTGTEFVRKVERSGNYTDQQAIELGAAIPDKASEIRGMLLAGDRDAAATTFADLQDVPESKHATVEARAPVLTPGISRLLADDTAELFQLYLYDSMAEDGDIVDIVINGEFFARVPITHAGATLAVPAVPGTQYSIQITGIFDGGGGVTVAFRSSEGDFFTKRMKVGQTQQVALISR